MTDDDASVALQMCEQIIVGNLEKDKADSNFRNLGDLACILPDRLYLGNIDHALSCDILHTVGIEAVVNCCANDAPAARVAGVTYLEIPAKDTQTYATISLHAVDVVKFVREQIDSGHRVLVHCLSGVNRSASLVVACLMHLENLSLVAAVRHVSDVRKPVLWWLPKKQGMVPNMWLIGQLVEYAQLNGFSLIGESFKVADVTAGEGHLDVVHPQLCTTQEQCDDLSGSSIGSAGLQK